MCRSFKATWRLDVLLIVGSLITFDFDSCCTINFNYSFCLRTAAWLPEMPYSAEPRLRDEERPLRSILNFTFFGVISGFFCYWSCIIWSCTPAPDCSTEFTRDMLFAKAWSIFVMMLLFLKESVILGFAGKARI